MPLPLQAEALPHKLVTRLGRLNRILAPNVRLAITRDWLSFSIAVSIDTDHGPIILPRERLEMNDAAVSTAILKMHEPRFAGFELNPSALVRSIDTGSSLVHHDSIFVRTVNILRAQHCLPARSHTARGRKNVVITIAFVELWSLDRRMISAAVEDHRALIEQSRTVGERMRWQEKLEADRREFEQNAQALRAQVEGHGEQLKAFAIAQAVFVRDASFDGQNDPVVRIEAGRIRRRRQRSSRS